MSFVKTMLVFGTTCQYLYASAVSEYISQRTNNTACICDISRHSCLHLTVGEPSVHSKDLSYAWSSRAFMFVDTPAQIPFVVPYFVHVIFIKRMSIPWWLHGSEHPLYS